MKILIVSGGTGGHIFPALSIACALKKFCESQIFFATDKRAIKIIPCDYPVFKLSIEQISFKQPLRMIKSIVKLMITFIQSLAILNNLKPDIVVGFGGYATGPVLFLAALKKMPTFIHEQNVLPGMANRLLSRYVDNIAISFLETKKYLPAHKNIIFTGCPLRQELFTKVSRQEALDFFRFQEGKFTILVMGGSAGSTNINHKFLQIAPHLKEIQAIHLTGNRDWDFINGEYKKLGNAHLKVMPFLKEMQYAYALADLVVARAGALTLAEISYFAKPAILVPYPYAGAHQMANAVLFKENNAAVLIKDRDLTPQILEDTIRRLLTDKERLFLMQKNSLALSKPNAHENLASEILSSAKIK